MRLAWIDLMTVIAGYVLAFAGAKLLGLPYAGSIAVLTGVLAASWRLARNSESWRTLGLRKPERWGGLALSVVVLYLLVAAGMLAIVQPLANLLDWPGLEVVTFERIRGNPVELAKMLAIVWTTAAIGEELLFRGFLLKRIETMLGRGAPAAAAAVVLQAVIFGVAHSYLGMRGIVTAMLVGLVFGTWFVLRGRNLLPLIVAHGLIDTISMLAIYSGLMPQ